MPRTASPIIRKLDETACKAILARNHVGRLAYSRENQLEIEPIHYVYSDGWIFGRTSHGAKTEMTGSEWWPVAFEVDEAENLFRWRSVLVHGGFYTLPTSQSQDDVAQWARAVELLGSLIPETLTDLDPVPHRTVVFGISVNEVSGREAAPADTPSLGKARPVGATRHRGGDARGLARRERSAPIALLGKPSDLGHHLRNVLRAAGFRVIEATAPADLIVIAGQAKPRVVIAAADAEEEWRRLLGLMRERLPTPIPLVLIGAATLPIEGVSGLVSYDGNRDEPSFARRILDEVQHAERKEPLPAPRPPAPR